MSSYEALFLSFCFCVGGLLSIFGPAYAKRAKSAIPLLLFPLLLPALPFVLVYYSAKNFLESSINEAVVRVLFPLTYPLFIFICVFAGTNPFSFNGRGWWRKYQRSNFQF